MAIHPENLSKTYSKLNRFRKAERYTDVTVDCIDGSFNCHRLALAAASDYFDRMFGSSFRESNEGNIALPTINGATFEQFLNFVYTGNVVINSTNICDLLEASEFLQAIDMQDVCVQFIELNTCKLTMQNALDVFAFARATGKKYLSTTLGCYIADQVDIFGKIDRFLDVSFDDLKFILNCQWPLSPQKAESFVGTFARWTRRHQGGPQCLKELLKLVKFENISAEYMKYALGKFIEDPENNTLTQFEKPIGYSETSKLSKKLSLETNTLLHVFVGHNIEKRVRVFSINRTRHCSISADVYQTELKYDFQSISDDSHLYCLSTTSSPGQKFFAYSSIGMCPKVKLRNPPIKFSDNVMCASLNNIYVYNSCLSEKATRICASPLTTSFDDEEINRGILVYNLEIDNWFPVPKMKKKLQEAGVALCEGSLFVIGGIDCGWQEKSVPGYAQALDCRTGKWRKLPKTYAEYCGAACCAIEGKIYVCGGGRGSGNEAERYDPVAGKWEKIAPTNKRWQYHKVVNYSNQMWAMRNFDFDEDPADLSIEIYNPKLNKWSSFLVLQEEAEKANFSDSAILDAVVFK